MKNLSEFLHSIPEELNKEEIYKKALPYLVKENLLGILKNQIGFRKFHSQLFELAKLPHGIGLGVSLMAQINIAGRVLQLAAESGDFKAMEILEKIASGELIISLGVSEPEWKGRLSNLKSQLTSADNENYILNGEKSFFTNGYHSDYFLVVIKFERNYKIVLLDKLKTGLQITKFSLPFAIEATHCKIKFENVMITKAEILNVDYSKYAENLRLSEMLSLASIFCGYSESILEKIKDNNELTSILKEDENKQKKLLRCKILYQMLFSHVLKISEDKDLNPNLELKFLFPYGTELVVDEFYSLLGEIFPTELIEPYFHDKQLFQFRDMLNESYIKRAAKQTSGIINTPVYKSE